MKKGVEYYTWIGTSVIIVLAIGLGLTALAFDEFAILDHYESLFAWGARVLVAGLVVMVAIGWGLTCRYLLSKNRRPATPADYLLLLIAVFMPVVAIYVLRILNRRGIEPET